MTSPEINPLSLEPGRPWPNLLDGMSSIAMVLLTNDGSILDANHGFYLLTEGRGDAQNEDQDTRRLFRQPDLRQLAEAPYTPGDNILYSGPFNILDPRGETFRPLRGSVYRLNERLLVVMEWDVIELEQSTITFLKHNEELQETLQTLENHNARLRHIHDELLRQILTDPLTGIANRRRLDEFLAKEIERCRRTARPLCVVMVDLDHFKLINDAHGHGVGDRVLCSFAQLLDNKLRSIDLAARYGGEEFILVLPETPLHTAVAVTERIRLALARLRIPPLQQITASFGIAQWLPDEPTDHLISRADRALYRAKTLGRNRVSIDIP